VARLIIALECILRVQSVLPIIPQVHNYSQQLVSREFDELSNNAGNLATFLNDPTAGERRQSTASECGCISCRDLISFEFEESKILKDSYSCAKYTILDISWCVTESGDDRFDFYNWNVDNDPNVQTKYTEECKNCLLGKNSYGESKSCRVTDLRSHQFQIKVSDIIFLVFSIFFEFLSWRQLMEEDLERNLGVVVSEEEPRPPTDLVSDLVHASASNENSAVSSEIVEDKRSSGILTGIQSDAAKAMGILAESAEKAEAAMQALEEASKAQREAREQEEQATTTYWRTYQEKYLDHASNPRYDPPSYKTRDATAEDRRVTAAVFDATKAAVGQSLQKRRGKTITDYDAGRDTEIRQDEARKAAKSTLTDTVEIVNAILGFEPARPASGGHPAAKEAHDARQKALRSLGEVGPMATSIQQALGGERPSGSSEAEAKVLSSQVANFNERINIVKSRLKGTDSAKRALQSDENLEEGRSELKQRIKNLVDSMEKIMRRARDRAEEEVRKQFSDLETTPENRNECRRMVNQARADAVSSEAEGTVKTIKREGEAFQEKAKDAIRDLAKAVELEESARLAAAYKIADRADKNASDDAEKNTVKEREERDESRRVLRQRTKEKEERDRENRIADQRRRDAAFFASQAKLREQRARGRARRKAEWKVAWGSGVRGVVAMCWSDLKRMAPSALRVGLGPVVILGLTIGKLFPGRYKCDTRQCSITVHNAVMVLCSVLFHFKVIVELLRVRHDTNVLDSHDPEAGCWTQVQRAARKASKAGTLTVDTAWLAFDLYHSVQQATGTGTLALGIIAAAINGLLLLLEWAIGFAREPEHLLMRLGRLAGCLCPCILKVPQAQEVVGDGPGAAV
jgi:hypothetical protein